VGTIKKLNGDIDFSNLAIKGSSKELQEISIKKID
jgi:hypothetical protein